LDKEGTPPLVAAIVLGWNHRDDSAECLASILGAGHPSLHAWYVDNGSTDDAPAFLRRQFPTITVIELGENRGLVGGYNVGIEAALDANAEYVCVFNNDVVVHPGAFQALVDVAQGAERAGLLVPKIVLYSDESILWSAGARERFFPPGIVQRGLGAPAHDRRFNQVRRVEYATSCAWMMASRMIHDVGLFDPKYSFYYSDYDYCRRVTLSDWHIYYAPGAIARHKVSLSTQRGPAAARWWRNMGLAESQFYRQYESYTQLAIHVLWIVMRTVLQGRARYIPAYVQGLRDGFDL
jgi:GT2 family glycosyltransferase